VDVDIFKRAGLSAAVADCDPAVKSSVHMITKAQGGRGAVREVIDLILKSRTGSRSR